MGHRGSLSKEALTKTRPSPQEAPVPELHRIFAWKDGGFWRGQELLPMSQIATMLGVLGWRKEVFATIQAYDSEGTCLSCPLYFDFDGKPDDVTTDVRHFVQACEFVINMTPMLYFSGNKGFHLIIDHPIEHPLCHLLVQDFAKELTTVKTLDTKVYRTNAMFRIPGSPGSAKGFYKIPITRAELFDLTFPEIRELARKRRTITHAHDISKIDTDVMTSWLNTALGRLPTYSNVSALEIHDASVNMEMTPCIHRMLTTPQLTGSRHESVFLLCRFFKLCGLDQHAAFSAITAQAHWSQYEKDEGDITKVLKSVYKTTKTTMVGCKGPSVSAEHMRSLCDKHCHFSPDFPKIAVTDLNEKTHYV